MPHIVSRLCVDCKDTSCADVCPVECFYEYKGDDKDTFANQLYINPDECIDCANCESACPWKAVFDEDDVPEIFESDIELNAKMLDFEDDFEVAEVTKGTAPTDEQVEANFAKHNYNP